MAFDRSKELRTYQPLDSDLTAIAALTEANDTIIVGTGGGWAAESGATMRTSLGVDAAGTDNSTAVTLTGTPNYITISGQVITRGSIDLADDVTGTMPVANGGTGATTLAGANIPVTTADTAWTGSQRATIVTANSGVFDLTAGQNFSCLPGAEITLTFTGGSASALSSTENGLSGYICLNNSGTKSILGDTTTFHDSSLLSTLSAGGKFLISYVCDGTYVYITNSAELSAGVS